MTYYITLEVQTEKTLSTKQKEKLREAVLETLDLSADDLPYDADVVTADIREQP